jgi:Flp pilus assembly protein TadD
MSEAHKAVFLSYASQDAEAAKRICDALRGAGVEVWFDQSELVGGDQWDGKIRGQISSCALFVPIISANTQARLEGYFRIEWKLAARRTHAMAAAKTFLFPVVIDATRDAEAHVPDEFREVQWTKLPGGETSMAFTARVRKLLGGSEMEAGRPRRAQDDKIGRPPAMIGLAKWWWVLPIFGVALALALVLKEGRKNPAPDPVAPTPIAVTPATKTVARVTAMLNGIDVTRAELDLASELLAQAVKADPADARLFAAWALVDCRYLHENYDQSPARYDAARRHVGQAASLDGANPEVRLARAITMQQVNQDNATKAEASALLDSLRSELPNDPRVFRQLGWLVKDITTAEEWWARQAKLPGQAADAAFNRGLRRCFVGDYRVGYAALVEASSLGRSTKVLLWKAYLEIVWLGDKAVAKRTMAEVPAEAFVEDMPASARGLVAYWSRDYEQALAASRAVPRDFMYSDAGVSPVGYPRGVALARLGRQAAAENEWRAALAATERRLTEEPNDWSMLMSKAILLAMLDKKPEAAQVWRTARELYGEVNNLWIEDDVAAALLPADQAIERLQRYARDHRGWTTAAVLRLNPSYDRFRADPAFVALQAEADADPRLSPTAADRARPGGLNP